MTILILRISIPSRGPLTCWFKFASLESDTDIIRMKNKMFFSEYPNVVFQHLILKVLNTQNPAPYTHNLSIHQFMLVEGSR